MRTLLMIYKATLSPVFYACGIHCRHTPTCSEYCCEACERFGVWPGMWMGFARFTRCRPGGTKGYDPVMDRLPDRARWYLPWGYGRW